jgi:hypothetical protein
MRDHLLALQEIQRALAEGAHDRAAELAERRLGMTSLAAHGAHDVAKFMPEGMRAAGSAAAVGDAATAAVVTGIVSIVVADGIFAVVLNALGF